MYIILEGMPITGKTTISKRIQEKINAGYMKSVVSETQFGERLKMLRNCGTDIKEKYELLIMTDLALDELCTAEYLKQGSLVRDKSPAAALGHLGAHGCKNHSEEIQQCIKAGYMRLSQQMIQPDIAVLIKGNKDKILQYASVKGDLSDIDKVLINDFDLYKKQEAAIEKNMREMYNGRFMSIDCYSGSVDEMAGMIIGACKNG